MRLFKIFLKIYSLIGMFFLIGCAQKTNFDYTAYNESKPTSILVLPPNNHSPDVKASYSMLSHTTYPLSESGYYVLPVALVAETFARNGLTEPEEIHQLPTKKLHEIFGADTALYIDVKDYGTTYLVIDSKTNVSAEAKLVDLRNGQVIWNGTGSASSSEENQNNLGLVGMVVQAAVKQVVKNLSDESHKISELAAQRLLTAGHHNGILYGPYSRSYLKDTQK